MISDRVKRVIKGSFRRFDLALLDLKKNNSLAPFLPGHLRLLLATLDINCVIDIGANVGDYGAMLRRWGYEGRIVSLEPVLEVYEQLVKRAAGDKLWRTQNLACGSKNETRQINVFDTSTHSSLLPPSDNMKTNIASTYVERTEDVSVRTMDSVFDEFVEGIAQPRVFLKIDTQGFDLEVARGGTTCMHRISGIQTELAVIPLYEGTPDYMEVLSLYREFGFEPTGFFPILNSPTSLHLIEFDAVLARRTTH